MGLNGNEQWVKIHMYHTDYSRYITFKVLSKYLQRQISGISLLAVTGRLFWFGSLLILDVMCRYLLLFMLYINIKIGKNRYKMLD